MKWTNRGHELDELGARYLKVKNLYIYGAGGDGKRMLKFLRWIKLDDDFCIKFIDSNPLLQGETCEGTAIISPEQFFCAFNAETDVLTICSESIFFELEKIYSGKLPDLFINYAEHKPDYDFLRRFISVYLMYKRGKLLSPHSNYIITTICNLNCRGCLNFNKYIKQPADESFENFKKHTDIVFSKFDYLASFHFSGGEVMLHKELPMFLQYISETYGDRIFELFFVTNGTIVPNRALLKLMKRTNCSVLLDDYRKSVPKTVNTFPKIKELFHEYGIEYRIANADYWYSLGITDKTEVGQGLSEEELIKRKSECGVHYFQDFFDGRIFGCCYIGYVNDIYPNKAAIYTPDANNDYIEIANTPKMEILEYRFGFTNKGYFDLCRRCSEMHGVTSVKIPVAQQEPVERR
jgi:organic radical activating enzyme